MHQDHNSIKHIGKYKILGEIGRGGMGVVYKALDPYIERTLAIKTIIIDPTHEELDLEKWKKRFLREAQLAGRLSHQNIVTIHDVGDASGLFYIAMEYVPGQSLRAVINSRKQIPLEEVQKLMGQICDGVSYAHKKGVIHCDIKPDNILLDESGNIIIVDFGIAKTTTSDGTQTMGLMVTPSYAAPERINGKAPSASSDIFSIGATLYEMVTGQKPFPGDNVSTVIKKILFDDPPRPTSINPDLPGQIDVVLAKALAKDPEKRYQSCDEFYYDLINYKSLSRKVLGDGIDDLSEMTFTNLHIPKKRTFGRYMTLSILLPAVVIFAGFSIAYVSKKTSAKDHDNFRVESRLLSPKEMQEGNEIAAKYSSKIITQDEGLQSVKTKDAIIDASHKSNENNETERHTTKMMTPEDHVGMDRKDLEEKHDAKGTASIKHDRHSNVASNDEYIAQAKRETKGLGSKTEEKVDRSVIFNQLLRKGKGYYTEKKYGDAINEFKNCISIDPDHKEAKKYLRLAQNKVKKQEEIKKYYLKGLKLFNGGKYSQAIAYFEKLLTQDKAHKEARKHLQIAVKKLEEKESIDKCLSFGMKSLKENNYSKAKFYFNKILKLESGNSDAKRYIQLAEKEEKIDKHFSNGVNSYDEGNFTETIAHFNQVLKLEPNHTEAKKYIEMAKLEEMDKGLDNQVTMSVNDQEDAKLPKGW